MIALFLLGTLGVVLVPVWLVGRLVQLARTRPRHTARTPVVIDIGSRRQRRRA